PFSLCLTLFFSSATEQVLGQVAPATQYAEASRQLAEEHDFAMLKAWSTGVVGWCAAEGGDADQGRFLLSEAIAALMTTPSRHFLSYLLGLLADTRLKARVFVDALRWVVQGATVTEAQHTAS